MAIRSNGLLGRKKEQSNNWKGDNACYKAKHTWLTRNFGRPRGCMRDPTHKGKIEWANISGKHIRDISDYIALCPTCHRNFDLKTHCKNGHEFTPENIYWWTDGKRYCRKCRIIRDKNRKK